MKTLVIAILTLIFSIQSQAQIIKLNRVCSEGNLNNLNWQISAGPCIILPALKVFGTESAVFPFAVIDSGVLVSSKQYINLNGNNKDWKYFLQYKIVCGVDTQTINTDTLSIDVSMPDQTYLDSISVDPITNVVYLGWTSNKTIDFNCYYLYNQDRTNPILESNYRDTFYTDLTSTDPRTKSLTYYITSVDSCNNRNAFGNPHKTINLTTKIDTCTNDVNLAFTAYVGWSQIKKQYIYRKINGGIFVLIDSIPANQLSYIDKGLPAFSNIIYFIRAAKLDSASRYITSSSNSSFVTSSKSVNPSQTKINYVSNNSSNQIELQIAPNPLSNYSAIDLYRGTGFGSIVKIYSFGIGETLFRDNSSITSVHNYYLIGKNVCGLSTDTSSPSNNIVIQLEESLGTINLNWNKYSTWNAGVKDYTIFRSTGNTPNDATNFTALKSLGTDTFTNDAPFGDLTSCYFILAYEQGGTNISKSNTVCNNKTGDIFHPNAISLHGINNTFTFSGIGIDLSKSSMDVYNRWGDLVYSKLNISTPWNGIDYTGKELDAGVYFFTAKIFQGTDTVAINGNVTILK